MLIIERVKPTPPRRGGFITTKSKYYNAFYLYYIEDYFVSIQRGMWGHTAYQRQR